MAMAANTKESCHECKFGGSLKMAIELRESLLLSISMVLSDFFTLNPLIWQRMEPFHLPNVPRLMRLSGFETTIFDIGDL